MEPIVFVGVMKIQGTIVEFRRSCCPYFYEVDKRYHRYYLDLKITFKEGKTILVEIKPDSQTKPPEREVEEPRHLLMKQPM